MTSTSSVRWDSGTAFRVEQDGLEIQVSAEARD